MADGPNYSVEVIPGEGTTTVAVSGELDIATAGDFEAALREQLSHGAVLLDLSRLSFMDSSGVHALDRILSELDGQGWTLRVGRRLRDNVRQILALTGLHDVIPFEPEPGAG